MPATLDTAKHIEALSSAEGRAKIRKFATRNGLEPILKKRILPILGLQSLCKAGPESIPAILAMLQTASLYPDKIDEDTNSMPNTCHAILHDLKG